MFCSILLLDNDLGHLTMQTETRMLQTFSIGGVSCKENHKVQVKYIHFLVGFGLGIDVSDSLCHSPSLALVIIVTGIPLSDSMLAFFYTQGIL